MIRIRVMEDADIEDVSEIERQTFSMPWHPEDFREMLKTDYAFYHVAEEDGRIVGCCGIRNLAGEGEITNVAVMESCRRRGIARKMLGYALEQAKENGVGACTLEVRISNLPAIRLYESFGFKGEGVRRGFYENPAEDALIMWKR